MQNYLISFDIIENSLRSNKSLNYLQNHTELFISCFERNRSHDFSKGSAPTAI